MKKQYQSVYRSLRFKLYQKVNDIEKSEVRSLVMKVE